MFLGRGRFVRCLGSERILIGWREWFLFVIRAPLTMVVPTASFACPRSWFDKFIYVIRTCRSQVSVCVFRQARARRFSMICIVADVTTSGLDQRHWGRWFRYQTGRSNLETVLCTRNSGGDRDQMRLFCVGKVKVLGFKLFFEARFQEFLKSGWEGLLLLEFLVALSDFFCIVGSEWAWE